MERKTSRPKQWMVAMGVVAFCSLALTGKEVQARVPYLDTVVGGAVDLILKVATLSDLEVVRPMQRVTPSPDEQARLDIALFNARRASGFENRYGEQQRLVLIRGLEGEPNAFATGVSIYISRGLLSALSRAELTAVVAHEMAHSERGHLTERMGHVLAGAVLHLAKTIAADWRYMTTGRADEMMQDLIRSGHWATLLRSLELAETGQEMQADCIARKWLSNLSAGAKRPASSPAAILSAVEHLVGVSASALLGDPVLGPRVGSLWSHAYDTQRCF